MGLAVKNYVPRPERPWALKDLPPYRPVARKLMQLTSQDDVSMSRLQEILRTDAAFAADVLRLANSPLISMRAVISSVLQAVMMLGLDRIKCLATTLALRAFVTTGVPSEALRECWRHNLATALICEKLARLLQIESETCYTAGLLHDIGRLALLRAWPAEYQRILSMDTADLLQAERSVFHIDHCEAGRRILEEWEFPPELCDVVWRHHRKPQPGESNLSRVVHAGWQMADLLGFSGTGRPVEQDLESIVAVLPGNAGPRVIQEFQSLADEVAFKINGVECSLAP